MAPAVRSREGLPSLSSCCRLHNSSLLSNTDDVVQTWPARTRQLESQEITACRDPDPGIQYPHQVADAVIPTWFRRKIKMVATFIHKEAQNKVFKAPTVLSDCSWVLWLLSECILSVLWPRKMKIECSLTLCARKVWLFTNKTQYFRLRLYDSDFWVLYECSLT